MLVQKTIAVLFFYTLHLMTDKVLPGYACQQATAGRYLKGGGVGPKKLQTRGRDKIIPSDCLCRKL